MRTLRLLLAALALAIGTSGHAAVLLLGPLPGSVALGATFSVSARAEGVVDLYAFQLDLAYSKDVLQLDSVQEGLGFQTGGGFFAGVDDPLNGTVSFVSNAILGPGPGQDGDFDLVTFVFTAIGSGVADLDFSNVLLLDSGLTEIALTSVTGGRTVVTGTAVPEPASALLVVLAVAGLLLVRAGGARR